MSDIKFREDKQDQIKAVANPNELANKVQQLKDLEDEIANAEDSVKKLKEKEPFYASIYKRNVVKSGGKVKINKGTLGIAHVGVVVQVPGDRQHHGHPGSVLHQQLPGSRRSCFHHRQLRRHQQGVRRSPEDHLQVLIQNNWGSLLTQEPPCLVQPRLRSGFFLGKFQDEDAHCRPAGGAA